MNQPISEQHCVNIKAGLSLIKTSKTGSKTTISNLLTSKTSNSKTTALTWPTLSLGDLYNQMISKFISGFSITMSPEKYGEVY